MYEVIARDATGLVIAIGPAEFASIDLARGFAAGIARWMLATDRLDEQIDITSDGERIEGATFAYWSQPEGPVGQST